MITSKKIMHGKMITITPDASMLDAYILMFDKRIRHLPVLDKDHQLVGILSDRDVQRAMVVDKTSEFTQEISLNSTRKVNDFMSWPVFTVREDTPLLDVIETMIEKKISAVIVQNKNEECSGILSTDDLLLYFADTLKREDDLKAKPLSFYLPNTLF